MAEVKLEIKVVPGSSRNRVVGWLGGALKVRVTAPAERGKANAAVEATIAEAVGVPAASVRVVAGHASPRKVIEIAGLSAAEVRDRLARNASIQ